MLGNPDGRNVVKFNTNYKDYLRIPHTEREIKRRLKMLDYSVKGSLTELKFRLRSALIKEEENFVAHRRISRITQKKRLAAQLSEKQNKKKGNQKIKSRS